MLAGLITYLIKAPPTRLRGLRRMRGAAALLPLGWLAGSAHPLTLALASLASSLVLLDIAWFFGKAGAFVFGSGLAIVPFLFGGVVEHHQWLTEQQFLDAVAVALISPGPVVITVAFIGYLIAGLPGATIAASATFLPCYLFTVLPAPLLRRYGRLPALTAAVEGIIVAAVGAIAGAVVVLGKRSITDPLTLGIAVTTYLLLWKGLGGRRIPEPVVVAAAALLGLALYPLRS